MSAPTSVRDQIAADLRAAIRDGRLGPGDALPSAAKLCATYDTSRVTVRRALELLRERGLIDMRSGAVARVRPTPSVKIAIVADDWRRHREAGRPGFDATVEEHGIVARQEVMRVEAVATPEHIAAALGLEDGEDAVMRFVRMWADETPVRLAYAWFPASWAADTPLAQPRRIRGGVAALIEQQRGRLAYSVVKLEGRNPTDDERELLSLARGVTVVQTTTTFLDASQTPVYVQEETADASRHSWQFRVEL